METNRIKIVLDTNVLLNLQNQNIIGYLRGFWSMDMSCLLQISN